MDTWSWEAIAGPAATIAVTAALIIYNVFARRLGERPYVSVHQRGGSSPEAGDTHWLLKVEATVRNPSSRAMRLLRVVLEQPPGTSFVHGGDLGSEVRLGVPIPPYDKVSHRLDIQVPAASWPRGTIVLSFEVAAAIGGAVGSPIGGEIVKKRLQIPFGN
jgi:hypothetical protein